MSICLTESSRIDKAKTKKIRTNAQLKLEMSPFISQSSVEQRLKHKKSKDSEELNNTKPLVLTGLRRTLSPIPAGLRSLQGHRAQSPRWPRSEPWNKPQRFRRIEITGRVLGPERNWSISKATVYRDPTGVEKHGAHWGPRPALAPPSYLGCPESPRLMERTHRTERGSAPTSPRCPSCSTTAPTLHQGSDSSFHPNFWKRSDHDSAFQKG